MWNDIDRLDWATLRHHYGNASDVPDLLRRCRGRDPHRVLEACLELENRLYHQGGWLCPAATAALPYLVDLAVDRSRHHREHVVGLIVALVEAARKADPKFVD